MSAGEIRDTGFVAYAMALFRYNDGKIEFMNKEAEDKVEKIEGEIKNLLGQPYYSEIKEKVLKKADNIISTLYNLNVQTTIETTVLGLYMLEFVLCPSERGFKKLAAPLQKLWVKIEKDVELLLNEYNDSVSEDVTTESWLLAQTVVEQTK